MAARGVRLGKLSCEREELVDAKGYLPRCTGCQDALPIRMVGRQDALVTRIKLVEKSSGLISSNELFKGFDLVFYPDSSISVSNKDGRSCHLNLTTLGEDV